MRWRIMNHGLHESGRREQEQQQQQQQQQYEQQLEVSDGRVQQYL
jgi:hypothetical protein